MWSQEYYNILKMWSLFQYAARMTMNSSLAYSTPQGLINCVFWSAFLLTVLVKSYYRLSVSLDMPDHSTLICVITGAVQPENILAEDDKLDPGLQKLYGKIDWQG